MCTCVCACVFTGGRTSCLMVVMIDMHTHTHKQTHSRTSRGDHGPFDMQSDGRPAASCGVDVGPASVDETGLGVKVAGLRPRDPSHRRTKLRSITNSVALFRRRVPVRGHVDSFSLGLRYDPPSRLKKAILLCPSLPRSRRVSQHHELWDPLS